MAPGSRQNNALKGLAGLAGKLPDIVGCLPEAAAKRAVEVGDVVETRKMRDLDDLAGAHGRISQQPLGAQQALLQHEAAIGDAGLLEQQLDGARAGPMSGRKTGERQRRRRPRA